MKRGAAILLFALTGCTPLRLFQTSVPAPITKPSAQIESERQAADLIAQKIETPVELRPVAVSLSASLGAPAHSLLDVKTFSLPAASHAADANLRDGIVQMQAQLAQLNTRLSKLQGKDVEGTGISILGPSTVLIIGGIVVLGVVFPPAFTVLLMLFRRLKATASTIVNNIDDAAKEPASAAAISSLKTRLSADMDQVHKRIVKSLQKV